MLFARCWKLLDIVSSKYSSKPLWSLNRLKNAFLSLVTWTLGALHFFQLSYWYPSNFSLFQPGGASMENSHGTSSRRWQQRGNFKRIRENKGHGKGFTTIYISTRNLQNRVASGSAWVTSVYSHMMLNCTMEPFVPLCWVTVSLQKRLIAPYAQCPFSCCSFSELWSFTVSLMLPLLQCISCPFRAIFVLVS